MRAGILNCKISVLFPKTVTSEYGENTTTWIKKFTSRANMKWKNQKRTNENNEVFYSTEVEFRVRIFTEISEFDRILYKNRQYRILSVIIDEVNQERIITTEIINE